MDKSRETPTGKPEAAVAEVWQEVGASFERFCPTAGVSALSRMMAHHAVELCGPRYGHKDGKAGAWRVGRRDRERRGGAGAAGQPDRARSGPEGLPAVHHRRGKGAAPGVGA